MIIDAIERLSRYEVDLIITIPIKNKQNADTVLKNLANIDLHSFKAAVILGLDKYCDPVWLSDFSMKLKQASSRFVFAEPVHTTLIDWSRYYPDRFYESLANDLEAAGLKDCRSLKSVHYVLREELRLIIKALNCEYVLWLDADELAPQDVISRLIRYTDGAGLVAGWAIDRHYPIEKATFDPLKWYKLDTKEESDCHEMINKLQDKWAEIIAENKTKRNFANGRFERVTFMRPQLSTISPKKIRSETSPIEIEMTGFGCVVKKSVNDSVTFLAELSDSLLSSEDSYFCMRARELGYKPVVDPTCYCEHISKDDLK